MIEGHYQFELILETDEPSCTITDVFHHRIQLEARGPVFKAGCLVCSTERFNKFHILALYFANLSVS